MMLLHKLKKLDNQIILTKIIKKRNNIYAFDFT